MDLERYEIEQLDEFTYRFFSTGVKGNFEMRVRNNHFSSVPGECQLITWYVAGVLPALRSVCI